MPDQKNNDTHVVADGDTLSAIAQKVYGDGAEHSWRKIYEANRDLIGDDPNKLKTGQRLAIPAKE